jgi:hypothetical protein
MLPEHRVQSPHEGGHSDPFRIMFEEPRGVGTQHTTSYEVVTLCPAQGGSEMTPSSNKVTTSDIVAHSAQEASKLSTSNTSNAFKGL